MPNVPAYMADAGVDSGWGVLYILLGILSVYSISCFADLSLIIPRLLAFFHKQSTDSALKLADFKTKVIIIFGLIVSFPIWSLWPLLIFFAWSTKTAYEGATLWFIASFVYFGLLAYTTLFFSCWCPLPLFYKYVVISAASYFLFIVTQLFGLYDVYSYTVAGTMWVAISAIPIIYFAVSTSSLAQVQALSTNHINEDRQIAYWSNVPSSSLPATGSSLFVEKITTVLRSLPSGVFYGLLYILSLAPIFIFAITAIVSEKTGTAVVAFVVIACVEVCGMSLYTDITPLANVYKLSVFSLGCRFVMLTSGSSSWLVVYFVVLSFASLLCYIRLLEVLLPDPGRRKPS